MTEKEKMLLGLPYKTRDPELLKMYFDARNLIQQYNLPKPDELDAKEFIK